MKKPQRPGIISGIINVAFQELLNVGEGKPKVEIHQLRYVLAVARAHSFSLAAEKCFVSQSTLSQQISKLEKELQVKLFLRNTRSVTLTEAGTEFIQQASGILLAFDKLEQSMLGYDGLLKGTLNLGAITSLEKIDFSNMVAIFFALHPNLHLNIMHGGSYELIDALRAQEIDLVFCSLAHPEQYPDISFETLGRDEYHLIVSSHHPFAKAGVINLSQAKNERFIFHHEDQSITDICMAACQEAGFTPNIICRNRNSTLTFHLVRAGLGIAFLPAEEIPSYGIEGVTQVRLQMPIQKNIVFGYLNNLKPSTLVKTSLNFFRDWCHQLSNRIP